MRLALSPTLLSLGIAVLVACSRTTPPPPGAAAGSAPTTPGSGGAPQAVLVHGLDTMQFDPSTIAVQAHQPVQLTFVNTGAALHDWSLADDAGQPVKIVAAGGQTASATFTLDHSGTVTFICSQPGHAAAGMHGTLTVQ
jgi:plastocyanin